jgi:hypothetical protein
MIIRQKAIGTVIGFETVNVLGRPVLACPVPLLPPGVRFCESLYDCGRPFWKLTIGNSLARALAAGLIAESSERKMWCRFWSKFNGNETVRTNIPLFSKARRIPSTRFEHIAPASRQMPARRLRMSFSGHFLHAGVQCPSFATKGSRATGVE